MNATSEKIASINDNFRKVDTMNLTRGIFDLHDVFGLVRAVRRYEEFNENNDPHGEHDFGSLSWDGQKVFWKIDYYDPAFKGRCDPLQPECERVLTVMLAEEY